MDKIYRYQGKSIRYQDQGKGSVLVLLHGFLENSSIWSFLIEAYSKNYRLISIDLPGHGLSEPLEEQSMPTMATMVKEILDTEGIKRAAIIGHSMGGYIGLAFSKLYGSTISGLCLFNSHPFKDTEEKKEERYRIVKALEAGKKDFIRKSIPNLMSYRSRENYPEAIEQMIAVAESCSLEGLKKSLIGMAERPSRLMRMIWKRKTTYAVIGEMDPSVPTDDLMDFCDRWNIDYTLIAHCGHLGYAENPEQSLIAINYFLKKVK